MFSDLRIVPLIVAACYVDGDEADVARKAAEEAARKAAEENKGKKTFSQDEVNSMMKKERESHITRLESLQKTAEMTDSQRKLLETQIEDLKTANLTEKERLTREAEKERKRLEGEKAEKETEAKAWQGRFVQSQVENQLTHAAVTADAFNPAQIQAILGPKSRLVEKVEDGKPTGQFEVKVKIETKDKDGKDIVLDETPVNAVKYLKESAEFANLFKNNQAGGTGTTNGSGIGQKPLDVKNMTHEEYLANRKTIMAK